jgi:hypothetical protein
MPRAASLWNRFRPDAKKSVSGADAAMDCSDYGIGILKSGPPAGTTNGA